MNIRLYHAAEVVGEAVQELVSIGSTRDRLHRAAAMLHGITPDEFRSFADLETMWLDIETRLSARQDEEHGSYRRSIERMSAPRMKELCDLILSLDRAIRATE